MKSRRSTESRGEGYWAGHCEGWRGSGLSQRVYCQRHGLALSTFQLWRRRLACEQGKIRTEPGEADFEIVPLDFAPSISKPPSCPLVLVVAGGRYRVEVNEGTGPDALRVLLDALEAR